MDFLNKAFAQLSDLFRSMTPGARITAGLLLLLVVVSLGYLFKYQVSGLDTDLMNGVPVRPGDLAAMEAAFAKAGLNSYEIRGTQILVPRGQKNKFMAALAEDNALPPNIGDVFELALEGTGAFTGNKERAERLMAAKIKKLEMTISEMSGIDRAWINYNTQRKGGFRKHTITTAVAHVKPLGSKSLDDEKVSSICLAVAQTLGMKPDEVGVIDQNTGQTRNANSEGGGTGNRNFWLALQRSHEEWWRKKILKGLASIDGVTVTPTVELDQKRTERTKSIKYAPKSITLQEKSKESSRTSEGAGPAGPPGYESQQPNAPAALAGSGSSGANESQDDSERETRSVTDTEQKETETVGPTPQRVTVAIGIPSSYFEKVWTQRNPPEEGQEPKTPEQSELDKIAQEETTKIQEFVAGMLPPPKDAAETPTDLVTVKTFQDIPGEEPPVPGMGEKVMVWFGQYWSTLGMIVLALFSLLMLRSMVRAVPALPQTGTAQATLPLRTGEEEEESAEAVAMNRLSRFSGGGPSLRDELSDLVKEDPDAAANILKTWIGSVS